MKKFIKIFNKQKGDSLDIFVYNTKIYETYEKVLKNNDSQFIENLDDSLKLNYITMKSFTILIEYVLSNEIGKNPSNFIFLSRSILFEIIESIEIWTNNEVQVK